MKKKEGAAGVPAAGSFSFGQEGMPGARCSKKVPMEFLERLTRKEAPVSRF